MDKCVSTIKNLTGTLTSGNASSISVKQAQKRVSGFVSPVNGVEKVPLRHALDRVLAEDIISPVSVPCFDNAAMDGFAFSSENLDLSHSVILKIVGVSLAGHPYLGHIRFGECIRIMTGAVIPEGCDTVVQQENVDMIDEMHLSIPTRTVKPGDNVRRAGENVRKGAVLLAGKTILRPAHLGILASVGLTEVIVHRKVTVALFSTGDELRPAGMKLEKGMIYDSNRTVLIGLMERLGCEVLDMGIVGDDPLELEAALRRACENADAIVTSGGVSVGAADYTKQVMAKMGDVAFWSIRMRPGRPMAFGRIQAGRDHAFLFGLPGNPVAVMVSFYFFVRNALLLMMGAQPSPLLPVRAQTATDLIKRAGRMEFQRGILSRDANGILMVRTTGEQGSGILSSMTKANGIITLPEERGNIRAGEWVDVIQLEGLV